MTELGESTDQLGDSLSAIVLIYECQSQVTLVLLFFKSIFSPTKAKYLIFIVKFQKPFWFWQKYTPTGTKLYTTKRTPKVKLYTTYIFF